MKMRKSNHYCFLLLTILVIGVGRNSSFAQTTALPIEKMDSSVLADPKPMLILLSTDWCKYCQVQKAQLRKNRVFQNKHSDFYYAEFNAETNKTVNFHENVYNFIPSGIISGIHELAIALNGGDEQLSFPTWIVLDKEYQVLFKNNGVLSEKQLNEVLNTLEIKKEPN